MLRSSQPTDPEERSAFIQRQLIARDASQRHHRLEEAALLVERAARAAKLAGLDVGALEAMLDSITDQLASSGLRQQDRIWPRNRPQTQKNWAKEGPRNRSHLFIDESGGSRLNLTPDSPYFAVGGLLISDVAYSELERRWNAWKVEWIGRENASMHADRLQRRSIGYYARAKPEATSERVLSSLEELIDEFDAHLFVAAIDKRAFQERYLRAPVDAFLPAGHYEICLDFLLERVTYCLLAGGDAHAHVFAESRNRSEDATLQLEYQRLQVSGTLFHAPTWFRYQLGPHITFHDKRDNIAGLQLVDVLLKATAEKLASPAGDPLRWANARRKLYHRGDGEVSGWGLKLFPGNEPLIESILGPPRRATKTEGTP